MFFDLLDFAHSLAGDYLQSFTYPWKALLNLGKWIKERGNALDCAKWREIAPCVWVHRTAVISPAAFLGAPCIVGKGTEIRHCAFIRGSAVIGDGCVVGNSTELKNAVLFDGVQVPHFNYVGDAILGYRAHLGAGAIVSNVKSDRSPVVVHGAERNYQTDLKKFGAIVGDFAEIGCNSVLNPGTIIGRNASVYPLSRVRGFVPENSIYKSNGTIVKKTT